MTELFYFMTLGVSKTTVLLFYLRVFPQPGLKNTCFITIGVVLLFTLASVLAGIFHCWPIEHGWTRWTGETEGKCFSFNVFAWAHAIISIVLDIFILALPIPTLAKLQMGRRKKINLFIMFSLGTL